MPRKILVPLDGSQHSHAIFDQLERVIGQDAAVVLLTVAEPSAVVVGAGAAQNMDPLAIVGSFAPATVSAVSKGAWSEKGEYAYREARKQLSAYLEKRAEPLRARGFDVDTEVCFGSAAEAIIDYARENDVDAIAMATHGRTGLGRLVFGSVAAKVLGSGVAPVVLFRPPQLSGKTETEEEK